MTSSMYHPPLDPATIRMIPVLRQQASAAGGVSKYLEASPYHPDLFPILKTLLIEGGQEKPQEAIGELNDDEIDAMLGEGVERELAALYAKLKLYGKTLTSEQGSEQASYFRVATSLMTKLVDLMEKAANISQVNAFRQRTMRILSDVMTPDQRNEFLAQMKTEFGLESP